MTEVHIAVVTGQNKVPSTHVATTATSLDDLLREYYAVTDDVVTGDALDAVIEADGLQVTRVWADPADERPEFEYVVEYDDIPVGLFYERAEQQLAVGGGAPSTMTDVKRLAQTLREQDAKVVGVHLMCPTCLALDEIALVDVDERLNRLTTPELGAEGGEFDVEAGVIEGQKEYQDDHFVCTARVGARGAYCMTKLEAPSGFEHHWG